MTRTVGLPALAIFILAHGNVSLMADAASVVQRLKPLQGINFDLGTHRGVGYFLSEDGKCKLVVTVADEPNWKDVQTFTATRFEAAITAGQVTHYDAPEGKVLEFACEADAQSMRMTTTKQYANQADR
jgi:hypothetical protein